jgi:hypothetical protein
LKKKLVLASSVVMALAMTTSVFAASTQTFDMFGDNIYHTHESGIQDLYPWEAEAWIPGGSESSAVVGGNYLFYPISAPNDATGEPSPTGQGYLNVYDMTSWSMCGGLYTPSKVKTVLLSRCA